MFCFQILILMSIKISFYLEYVQLDSAVIKSKSCYEVISSSDYDDKIPGNYSSPYGNSASRGFLCLTDLMNVNIV